MSGVEVVDGLPPGRRRVLRLVLAAALTVLAIGAISPFYRLVYNATDSLPGVLYLVRMGEMPGRGDIAAFRPPPNAFYPETLKFLKVAAGVPGDIIEHRNGVVFVNTQPMGVVHEVSAGGVQMTPGPVGQVPDNHFFFWTPQHYSLDSRYADIGFVPSDRVLGRALRLF